MQPYCLLTRKITISFSIKKECLKLPEDVRSYKTQQKSLQATKRSTSSTQQLSQMQDTTSISLHNTSFGIISFDKVKFTP